MRQASSLFVLVALVPSVAFADPQLPQAAAPLATIWWVPIASALIGAVSALGTTVLKDYIFQKKAEERSKTNENREIFRNYAAPLAGASEKLLWRFSEIFIDKRHHFLKKVTLPLVYNEYKRTSTLYRIACLLGWIRAVNLELSALPRGSGGGTGALNPASDAIGQVQSALADGPQVELHRLEQVCSVWRLKVEFDGKEDDNKKKSLATKFEVKLYSLAGNSLKWVSPSRP